MKLYLIRHGRQSSNLCNVNVELSEAGHRQAVVCECSFARPADSGAYQRGVEASGDHGAEDP